MEISFKLEVFEGPLDLLLHLIKKNKVSIYDIPIALITEQYLEYIKQMEEADLDVSSDFLVMASRLLYIKSKLLLPVYEEEEGEEEDPRQELIQNLVEYKRYKDVSLFFNDRKNICDYIYFKEPDKSLEEIKPENKLVDISRLVDAFNFVMLRAEKRLPPSKTDFKGIVGKEPVPVKSKIRSISVKIRRKGKIAFNELFDDAKSRSEIVAIFLAVLELLRNREIGMNYKNEEIILEGTNG